MPYCVSFSTALVPQLQVWHLHWGRPWATRIHMCCRRYTSCLMETLLLSLNHISFWMASTSAYSCAEILPARLLQALRVMSMSENWPCVYFMIIWSHLSPAVHCVLNTPNKAPYVLLGSVLPHLTVIWISKIKHVKTCNIFGLFWTGSLLGELVCKRLANNDRNFRQFQNYAYISLLQII